MCYYMNTEITLILDMLKYISKLKCQSVADLGFPNVMDVVTEPLWENTLYQHFFDKTLD